MSNPVRIRITHTRLRLRARLDDLAAAIADRLPESVAYWAAIRVIAHATTGPWSGQVVPDLNALDALQRWPYPPVVHIDEDGHLTITRPGDDIDCAECLAAADRPTQTAVD